ncbi:dnaJ homolog subfamily A member 3, mitochondrial-like [Malaya genurostris]|uniref:dnaJ homolog subfamily A member 3, mitochondrial-like n=1 Tax=Malaya genurostris TaxID=325434 RepID=UPI0026F3A8A2|nr:dnaJ homolog subfamily A member 3, mitochondrial-like [Malaya genurostris]
MIDKFKFGSGLIRYIKGTPIASPKPKFKYIRPTTTPAATPQELTAVAKDYYSILGVRRSASFRDIKQAYYTLAKEFHPDLQRSGMENLPDEAKFKEITEAYEALMSEQKKGDSVISLNPELYKNVGTDRRRSIASAWNTVNELNYEDVILSISFKEAAEGSRREIKLPIGTKCEKCSAWGTFPPMDSEGSCNICQGTGKQTLQTESGTLWMTCKFCKGSRVTPQKSICPKCHGKGIILKPHPLMIHIPKGSKHRDIIKARIPGNQRSINIILNIQDVDRFQRNGLNIHTTEEVTLTQAILGANIPIKGINGVFNVHIPPGTQPDAEIRVPGKGVWDASTQEFGQHIVKVKIRIPTQITSRQRHLLKELEVSMQENSSNKVDSPFSR